MNPLFSNLSEQTLSNIEDQLSNNDSSSSEELVDFFIEELGLSSEQAEAAVELRSQYLIHIFPLGQEPLRQTAGRVFDPSTRTFR